ncbi:hypothetical protein FRC08_004341 [Ceratobasidium sp. 394]|nr:hypothetical protein FRC08_004341 [Ceratobasidium sp. 394]KAG9082981.1 hypothetical protein FS749_006416 [Ceratobasidium sp. UAMH 11750]
MAQAPTLNNTPHQARLRARIASLVANPPDTEYSHYGPINELLHLYFPLEDFWMVKPQAPIRDLVAGHGSTDSTGRNVDSNGRGAKRPDFIVTRFSGTGRQDVIDLVIEIKASYAPRNSAAFNLAFGQLSTYMLQLNNGLAPERGGAGFMRGLFITGTICHSAHVAADGTVEVTNELPFEGVDILAPAFRQFLQQRVLNALPAPAL